jgi:hypothetical protein
VDVDVAVRGIGKLIDEYVIIGWADCRDRLQRRVQTLVSARAAGGDESTDRDERVQRRAEP